MTEKKRFELQMNGNGQLDIVDWVESEEKDSICIYNDLGVFPFSSAEALCDLLNQQENKLKELYDFRLVYNAHLFNEWCKNQTYEVYKSRRHSDGELCFEGDWFVVVALLPTGQITNHYHMDYWDYFKIPAFDKAKDEFDGHTSSDVLLRLRVLLQDD